MIFQESGSSENLNNLFTNEEPLFQGGEESGEETGILPGGDAGAGSTNVTNFTSRVRGQMQALQGYFTTERRASLKAGAKTVGKIALGAAIVAVVAGGALLLYMYFSHLKINKAGFAKLGKEIVDWWNSGHTLSTGELLAYVVAPTTAGAVGFVLLFKYRKAIKDKAKEKLEACKAGLDERAHRSWENWGRSHGRITESGRLMARTQNAEYTSVDESSNDETGGESSNDETGGETIVNNNDSTRLLDDFHSSEDDSSETSNNQRSSENQNQQNASIRPQSPSTLSFGHWFTDDNFHPTTNTDELN